MIKEWDDLSFWQSGEWQVIEERLSDYDKARTSYNPHRDFLFAALDACPFSQLRCVILGQDPYPDKDMATGLAFSVPKGTKEFPPSLQNILIELKTDMGYEDPITKGDLSEWAAQGVLLWNVYPTCFTGRPGSHHWPEWKELTKEIVKESSEKGVVFGFLGKKAYDFKQYVDESGSSIVFANHPSPLSVRQKVQKHPWFGSRFFSTINAKLVEMKQEPIDWRL